VGPEKLADQSRLVFIDVARSFAIIFMLEGHFISLTFEDYFVVHDAIKEFGTSGNIYMDYWHDLRSYTAPLFFTITGLVLGYLLMGHKGEPFWKQKRVSKGWRRGLLIMAWGYILQLRYTHREKYFNGEFDRVQMFHVLQCIGLGLLFLLVLYGIHHVLKKVKFSLILFIAGLFVFHFYPVIRAMGDTPCPSGAPLFIQNMINGPGSVFPIFPHMGFIFLGASIGALFREYSKYIKKIWFPALFVAGSILMIYLIKESVRYLAHEYPSDYSFVGGLWLYKRLRYIIIFIGILMYAEQFIKMKGKVLGGISKFFIGMGQNTLNIYIVHSILLYGSIVGFGIKNIYNKNANAGTPLSFGESVIGAILFILFFGFMTHFQPQIKNVLMYIPRKILPQKKET